MKREKPYKKVILDLSANKISGGTIEIKKGIEIDTSKTSEKKSSQQILEEMRHGVYPYNS